MEEFSHLRIFSSAKKAKDDLVLEPSVLPHPDLSPQGEPMASSKHNISIPKFNLERADEDSYRERLRDIREKCLGPWGLFAERASKQRHHTKQEHFSLTLISAIAYDQVIANQLVEGGVDASVFEHFIFRMLEYVRNHPQLREKRVVVLMDNATIHRHASVIDTVLGMKAILMFNPPYSPQLNPVEMLFKRVKAHIREKRPRSR